MILRHTRRFFTASSWRTEVDSLWFLETAIELENTLLAIPAAQCVCATPHKTSNWHKLKRQWKERNCTSVWAISGQELLQK